MLGWLYGYKIQDVHISRCRHALRIMQNLN